MDGVLNEPPPVEAPIEIEAPSPTKSLYALCPRYDANNNVISSSSAFFSEDKLVFPKPIAWSWDFSPEGVARGVLTAEKFMICLPFCNGGTGESNGTMKKFERISDSNFSWTIGLSNQGDFGTGFWRMELEVIRNLNMLAMIVSRDISRQDEAAKRLKRVRKVYRLPDYYDIRTLQTKTFDWAIILEALPQVSGRRARRLRRADTLT
ncbi:hypothetical protein M3Y99_01508100 [Aphelenchoides fujianensis]|nr:hypothetical protein M3Y99_01508100 [Aphelenchoides fujianensis]